MSANKLANARRNVFLERPAKYRLRTGCRLNDLLPYLARRWRETHLRSIDFLVALAAIVRTNGQGHCCSSQEFSDADFSAYYFHAIGLQSYFRRPLRDL